MARRGYCWDEPTNECDCQSRRKRQLRVISAAKIPVQMLIENCDCDLFEGGNPGTGPRQVRVICTQKEEEKKKDVCKKPTDCRYDGNLHPCKQFNKRQEQFYQELLHVIINFQCHNFFSQKQCPIGPFHTNNTTLLITLYLFTGHRFYSFLS